MTLVETPVENSQDEKLDTVQQRLTDIKNAICDAVIDTRGVQAVVSEDHKTGDVNNNVVLRSNTKDGEVRFNILSGAHQQLADRISIPKKYYDRMLTGQPALLAENINTWFRAEPEERLFRLLRPVTEDQQETAVQVGTHFRARAILSSSYRPIDNHELLQQIVTPVVEAGAKVSEFDISDRNFHIRFTGVDRSIQAVIDEVKLRNPNQPAHSCNLNEIVSFGVSVRNSETGHGALVVEPVVEILRCINRYVQQQFLRLIHAGAKNEAENFQISDEAARFDDGGAYLKARDAVVAAFDEQAELTAIKAIGDAYDVPIVLPQKLPLLEFVGNVGRRFDFTDQQVDMLQDEFLSEVELQGRRTQWGLGQAVTAVARRSLDEGLVDFNRKAEIETFGWKVLGDPLTKLIDECSKN